MWARMTKIAKAKLESGEGDKEFYEAKIHTANFFFTRLLPDADACFKKIMAGAEPLMEMKEAQF